MSQWFALLYKLKPGSEDSVTEAFQRAGRPDHDVRDDGGEVIGRLLTTLVFMGEGACVRVIEVDGDIQKVARHMARQEEVKEFETEIEEHLAEPRDMKSPGGAQEFFKKAGMRNILHRRHDEPV
jgi:hypothetical protein